MLLIARRAERLVLLKFLTKLCSRVPLIDEKAIEDHIHIAVMKPIRLAQNPLLEKAEALGDGSTARVVYRTGDHNFLYLVLFEGIPHHRATRLGDNAFSLQRSVQPVAQFDRAVLPPIGC